MSEQKLKKYFGMTVSIVREVDSASYTQLTSTLRRWLDEHPDIKALRPELYVHKITFDIARNKFKVQGIENRVSSLRVSVAINPKQRQDKSMKFINHKVGHRLRPEVSHNHGDYENWYELKGEQLTSPTHFEEYLATLVLKPLSVNDRKVKFILSAQATPAYKSENLKNVKVPVVTKMDFPLNRDVQLTLHFDGTA